MKKVVLQNETVEFLQGHEIGDRDNLTQFSDRVAALAFLHRVAAHLRDISILRSILVKESNGITVCQLDDSQVLEVLADRLFYGGIKVKRTPRSMAPSAVGTVQEKQQYMTPLEVEQTEKRRRGERRLIPRTSDLNKEENDVTEGGSDKENIDKKTVTIYRVDDNAYPERIVVSDNGAIEVPVVNTKKGKDKERALFINFDNPERAKEFALENRKGDATIKTVEVDASLLEDLRKRSITEREAKKKKDSSSPIRVDKKFDDQFGLRTSEDIQKFRDSVVPNSGKTVDPDDL